MRKAASVYTCALLLTTTAVAGQDAKVTTESKVTADDGKVVKMTGCLELGGGTSFVLTNITSEQDHRERPQVPPRGPYALVERKGLDLGPFIQQRVEVTGVVVPAATKRDTQDRIKIKETTKVDVEPGSDKTTSTATTVKVPRGATTQFLVASVKTLAPSCQP